MNKKTFDKRECQEMQQEMAAAMGEQIWHEGKFFECKDFLSECTVLELNELKDEIERLIAADVAEYAESLPF